MAQYRYTAFGQLEARSGTFAQPFGFSTKRYDDALGLNYYGYRFYNPAIERWMNRDPLGEAGGMNLYGFVQNDPVNWVDPWGLEPGGSGPWTITFDSPTLSERIKGKLKTDLDKVKYPDRYGPSARLDTVGTYGGTAITAGAIGTAHKKKGTGLFLSYIFPRQSEASAIRPESSGSSLPACF